MGPFGFGSGTRRAAATEQNSEPGPPLPPAGTVFLIDNDGALLTDADGAYLMEPA